MTVTIDLPEWAVRAYDWPYFWLCAGLMPVYLIGFFVARATARDEDNPDEAAMFGLVMFLGSPIVVAIAAFIALGWLLSRPFKPRAK